MNNISAITAILLNRLPVRKTCNVQKLNENKNLLSGENKNFNYDEFLEEYAHDICDSLAFWLHDNYGLKIGVIRAIDMNDEDDTDYQTVVHYYAKIGNGYIIDARGIDTEREMLMYYADASVFDDEEWDFLIDNDYSHEPKETASRTYSEKEENDILNFLSLLDINIRNQFQNERVRALGDETSPAL